VKLTFYVLMWAHPGMENALVTYEDTVLGLIAEHGREILQRAQWDIEGTEYIVRPTLNL
jgi:hypothetical protein